MDGSSVMVKGDAAKLVQVLTNLVVNSINYGNAGGHTEIRYYDAEDSILVEVADSGIGIKEEDLPRVFERFYRVDKSRSRHAGGSTRIGHRQAHRRIARPNHQRAEHLRRRVNLQLHAGEGRFLKH